MRLLFLLPLACSVWGQDFRATITGQITDPSKAAIPGATIKAVRIDTNETTQAASNADGYYTLPYLAPGRYTVEVSAPGFNTLKRENIVLLVADKLDLPLVLQLGSVSTSVTVSAEVETLESATASGGQNFDSTQTSEYPLDGRQVYMLMELSPGVLFTQEEFGATGFSGNRGWDVNGNYIINGGLRGTNQFLLNGAPISTTGTWQVAPNVDAIQEFKVMANTYDAQYGRTGGGTMNTTLKSGTNSWHGTLFEYFRNSVLDANNTQNNSQGAPRGKHIRHQFGGTVGGPIRRNRDFLFLSFEGFRERVPFPAVRDTPPLELRDGRHFSDYQTNIFDPLTVRQCRKGVDTAANVNCYGTYIRSPFPGNAIPESRMSPVGRKILALWPAPNAPEMTQNFFATANTGIYRYDQPMGRWDHQIGDRDRLFAIVSFQHGSEFRSQNGFPPPAETGNIVSQRRPQHYIADWTRILSPRSVLDLRASFGRFTSYFPDGQRDFDFTADKLGMIMPHPPTVNRSTAPRVNLDLFTSIIGNRYTWGTDNQWNLAPSVTYTHGRHTTKLGGEYAYLALGRGDIGRANGEFSFSRTWTQQYSDRGRGRGDGSGVADLLLGLPASGFIDYNDTYYRSWHYWALYVQDDWKALSRLTLNLGLRYDVQVPFVERWDRVNTGFDFNTKNPLSDAVLARWRELKQHYDAGNPRFPYPDPPGVLTGGKLFLQPGGSRRTYHTDWGDIQPRIGIAWNFAPKTVLRTGFGIYYRTATQGNYTDGFSQRTNYIPSFDGGIHPAAPLGGPGSLADPFPDGIAAPTGSSLGLLTNIGRAISFDGLQRVIPRTYQYSFGFQRWMPWSIKADISYVGSQTVHDTMDYQADYISYDLYMAGHATPSLLNRKVPNPFYGILPMTSDFGRGPDFNAENLMRPLPLFNGITQKTNPWARYRYDSLQLRVEKRMFGSRRGGGLLTIFSYTVAKSFEAAKRLQAWNLNTSPLHQLSSYDKPQNVAFSGVWDLPLGKGRKLLSSAPGPIRAAVSGWNVNWIYTYYSGYPTNKPTSMFLCQSYFAPVQNKFSWFNNDASCFRDWPSYTTRDTEDRFPNIRNPARPNLNLTAARTIRVSERYQLQLRGESFNTTNSPMYLGPTTDYKNPRFGKLPIEQKNFPRLIQVAVKVLF